VVVAPVDEAVSNSEDVEAALSELNSAEDDGFTDGAAPRFAPSAPPRPARQAAAPTTTQPAEVAEPRAAALASAIQIQLGAFESEEVAAQQWEAIKSRNSDLLEGRGRVITPVLSGGKRLFRLRAGPFDTVQQASALCRGLKGRNEACIVARAR
jgi:cell division septation protein DedD